MILTIFYDSTCPLCMAEMRELRRLDVAKRLCLEDLFAGDFSDRYPHIDRQRAIAVLHGQLDSGEVLLGLDCTRLAWALVGKKKWLAVLRWPVIKPLADWAYLLFARHRARISRLLTGQATCEPCGMQGPGYCATPAGGKDES